MAESTKENLCFVVTTLQDALICIREYELQTCTKYVVEGRKRKNFGETSYDPTVNHYIMWKEKSNKGLPFSGVPFIVINCLYFDCVHGPERHANYKAKLYQKGVEMKKTRTLVQITKKLGCLAKVRLKEVIYFPEYKIQKDTMFYRRKISKQLRNDLKCKKMIQQERKIIVQLPHQREHTNHLDQ